MLQAGDQTEIGEKVVIIAQENIICLAQKQKNLLQEYSTVELHKLRLEDVDLFLK